MSGFIIRELGTGGYVADDECWLIKKLKVERRKILAVIDQPVEYVAFFHTHTPLTYCSGIYRSPVGPSSTDQAVLSNCWDSL